MNVPEFVACYGFPRTRFVEVAAAGGLIVPRDPERYLLVMVEGANVSRYIPGQDGVATSAAILRAAGAELAVTFASFGSLVCEQWSLASGAFPTTVLVVEGFVRDLRSCDYERTLRGEKAFGERPERVTGSSVGSGSVPQSTTLSVTTLR